MRSAPCCWFGPLLLAAGASAWAQDDIDDEVVVWGDLFARWDNTRWLIKTEMGLPYGLVLQRDENTEFPTNELQVHTILACNKDWKLSRRKYEVGCSFEDFAIQANIARRRVREIDVDDAQAVLNEIDSKLQGASVTLQVADDGRVLNIGLDGLPRQNRRQSLIQETLRQIVSRLVTGYNLKLQKFNQLHEGKWVEYNSNLMSIPLPNGVSGSMGSNILQHYLNRYRGHVVVQSIGKGTTVVEGITISTDLIGVSIFDDRQGFMTERVWALEGTPTASSFFESRSYFHAGRLTMLGTEDRPDVGPTRIVNGRSQTYDFLPVWEPIERP